MRPRPQFAYIRPGNIPDPQELADVQCRIEGRFRFLRHPPLLDQVE